VIVVSLTKPTPNNVVKAHILSIRIRKGVVLKVYLLCNEHVYFEISIMLTIYDHMLGISNSYKLLISIVTQAITLLLR